MRRRTNQTEKSNHIVVSENNNLEYPVTSPCKYQNYDIEKRLRSYNLRFQHCDHQYSYLKLYIFNCNMLLLKFKEIKVELSAGDTLGINIQGGYGSVCGNKYDKTDEGIFVSKVNKHIA